MTLTDELKQLIDGMTYERLLYGWRHTKLGDPMMQGETGDYWRQRMRELRESPGGEAEHVRASKAIGWNR